MVFNCPHQRPTTVAYNKIAFLYTCNFIAYSNVSLPIVGFWKGAMPMAGTVRIELTTNDPKSFVLPLYYVPIYTAQNVKTINTLNNYKQT